MTLTLLDPEPDEPDDGRLAVPDGFPMAPAQAVYHGLAGEIVQTIAPHTEADPVAILAQLLVAFGAAVGRGAHRQVEAAPPSPQRVPRPRRRQRESSQGLLLGSRAPAPRHRRPDARH